MRLIDTHTHLYQPNFDDDRSLAMERCFQAGVDTLLLPNIDMESVPRVLDMMEKWPNNCFGMMGLHPCHVLDGWEKELESIRQILDSPSYGKSFVAIGEIGMDLYWEKKHIDAQREAFRIQVGWAKERGLPIVIHVRDAWEELFKELDYLNDDSLNGVFHCFTGGAYEAQRALDYGGFMLGIGGVSTYKNGGLDKVLPGIPLESLVIETDSPYLPPVPYRGKRNESSYVLHVANRLADIMGVSLEEVASITTANAEKMFGLKVKN
ncbi:MAG: hydrolase TatD [Bacteroidetes bacterium]|nr:MAG: hydrolase TatD [Bacteroidota bacterium]